MLSQIVFALLFTAGIGYFLYSMRNIYQNITLGHAIDRFDQPQVRLRNMLLIAFGQQKMFKKPLVALLHAIVYVGFCIINIELIEIILDGLLGTHRLFANLGIGYNILIAAFEILALLVIVSCVIFLYRRNIFRVKRLNSPELANWPTRDANIILLAEIALMSAFLIMNAADLSLQHLVPEHYPSAGSFPISQFIVNLLPTSVPMLIVIERFCWWFHIMGILIFMNYIPYSKHLHILLAFPNTYFANLNNSGQFQNNGIVTDEVKAMLDPSLPTPTNTINRFGVKDVTDLTWKNLLDAYTCTECGRCTAACPANITGKKLSPRKIMMDTRDRLEEVGKLYRQQKEELNNEKSLLDHYITREEIWACTTCNACVEQCPVSINPLEIIIGLRQYIVMEESQAPHSLNNMFTNLENNAAPWKYAQADRASWTKNI